MAAKAAAKMSEMRRRARSLVRWFMSFAFLLGLGGAPLLCKVRLGCACDLRVFGVTKSSHSPLTEAVQGGDDFVLHLLFCEDDCVHTKYIGAGERILRGLARFFAGARPDRAHIVLCWA